MVNICLTPNTQYIPLIGDDPAEYGYPLVLFATTSTISPVLKLISPEILMVTFLPKVIESKNSLRLTGASLGVFQNVATFKRNFKYASNFSPISGQLQLKGASGSPHKQPKNSSPSAVLDLIFIHSLDAVPK